MVQYWTTAAGAMRRAGRSPAKKTSGPSSRNMESMSGSVDALDFLSCIRHLTTSIGEETTVAAQYADITAIALSLPSEEAGRGVEASCRLGEEREQTNGRSGGA